MNRIATLALVLVTIGMASVALAADDDDDKDVKKWGNDKTPADAGVYLALAGTGQIMDTPRLAAKIRGADPFPLITPGVEFELHAFQREGGLIGLSGGLWGTETDGPPMDATLSGWEIRLDLGNSLAELRSNSISFVFGMGYGRNNLDLDGDFSALDIHDAVLPTRNGRAELTQQGFVYDFSLRADQRAPFASGDQATGLVVSGLSLGYKGGWWTKWNAEGNRVSNLPYVNEHVVFFRLHIGLGVGAYLGSDEES